MRNLCYLLKTYCTLSVIFLLTQLVLKLSWSIYLNLRRKNKFYIINSILERVKCLFICFIDSFILFPLVFCIRHFDTRLRNSKRIWMNCLLEYAWDVSSSQPVQLSREHHTLCSRIWLWDFFLSPLSHPVLFFLLSFKRFLYNYWMRQVKKNSDNLFPYFTLKFNSFYCCEFNFIYIFFI